MDNFKAVYKILSTLEKAMDLSEFDIDLIGPKVLDISQERWYRYLEMMLDAEYIKGVRISKDIAGNVRLDCNDIRITLKGMEYLHENSIMQKMYNLAKGIKEVAPML